MQSVCKRVLSGLIDLLWSIPSTRNLTQDVGCRIWNGSVNDFNPFLINETKPAAHEAKKYVCHVRGLAFKWTYAYYKRKRQICSKQRVNVQLVLPPRRTKTMKYTDKDFIGHWTRNFRSICNLFPHRGVNYRVFWIFSYSQERRIKLHRKQEFKSLVPVPRPVIQEREITELESRLRHFWVVRGSAEKL